MTGSRGRVIAIWFGTLAVITVPLLAATQSPLLAWRDPIYIAAGFAGILGMGLLFAQPLLARGLLPGAEGGRGRHLHRMVGMLIVIAVVAHVLGLWITSPPDVIDVLLFRSPTPFAIWGAAAMWAVFATAGLAATRRRWHPRHWRWLHAGLASVIVIGTVVHAVQIDGTMEPVSKVTLALGLTLANGYVIWRLFRGPEKDKGRGNPRP